MKNKCILGLDTSNYRTSVALVDLDNNLIVNYRELLEVKKGERGLQQSYALFQHLKKLPVLIERAIDDNIQIVAVAVSSRPRNIEGSYMPVFTVGENIGRSIASSLHVPIYDFSHQEGHFEAARYESNIKDNESYIAFHLSGGTTEAILFENDQIKLVGGSLDLALGQVIDRVGVKLGFDFPSGKYLDEIITQSKQEHNLHITSVKVNDGYFNLSGLETQLYKMIDKGVSKEEIVKVLFDEILNILCNTMTQLSKKYMIDKFLFAGGVSSSEYIKNQIKTRYNNVYFAREELSGDNAVGVALLGGKAYGKKASNNNTTK